MRKLEIPESVDTPQVTLDADQPLLEIKGRSLPEDCVEFYAPVFEWLSEYKQHPNAFTHFVFKLDYFNTASSKIILDLLIALKSIPNIKIHWHYTDDDEDILESGLEFAEQVTIPFEFKK